MNKNIEKELKILVTQEQFEKLRKRYEPLTFQKQVNQYYDTVDHAIRKKNGAMRIRTKNHEHIFTLKLYINNELHEFECNVQENSLAALQKPEIQSLLQEYDIKMPVLKIGILTTYRAVFENEDAELCFDENFYNNQCDYEIEYEYKREHDGLLKFNQILSKVNLHYETNCKAKIARAIKK